MLAIRSKVTDTYFKKTPYPHFSRVHLMEQANTDNFSNNTHINLNSTCYVFLSMLYLTFMAASLLLSYRFVNIAGILTVGSVFVIPLTYAISDIISELYGFAAMRATIWKMLICLFILFSSIFLIIK